MEPDDGAGQISAGEFGVAFKGFLEQAAAQAPVEPSFFVLFEGGELTRSLLGGHVSQGA